LITAAWEKAEHDEHTWSMERLRERDVQRGEGAHITLRGNQRHIATQLMTGTMSTHGLQTLLEMLGGGGGGKWATVHARATTLLKTTKTKTI
jgi:hypothetical protein